MANKKISQLIGLSASEDVSGAFLLPVGAGPSNGPYVTKQITTTELAEFVCTGNGNGFPATRISGLNKDIYFDNNDNWQNASNTDVASFPFLQVRKSDGLLVTGSGVAFDSATTPWNYTATSNINMQGNDIDNLDDITFYNSTSYIRNDTGTDNLTIKAGKDLILTGIRYIDIDASAIDVTNSPFSGNVFVTGGNLEIDPSKKLVVNEITVNGSIGDKASLSLQGAMDIVPVSNITNATAVNWSLSNIQYEIINQNTTITFNTVENGQTLTMYVANNSSSAKTATFASGNAVVWGGEYDSGPPAIPAAKTNLYTFIRINTGIFASAVTGYEYY
jgi:hypothetical protein